MAPSSAKINETLKTVISNAFDNPQEREVLSVTYARTRAEEALALDEGFLSEGAWKAKSKDIIKTFIAELLEREGTQQQTTEATSSSKPTKPLKRASTTQSQPATKKPKPKKATPTTKQKKKSDESSELSSALSDLESDEKPKPKSRKKRSTPDSESEDEVKPKKQKRIGHKVEPDNDEDLPSEIRRKEDTEEETPAQAKDKAQDSGLLSDSDLSSLIDEAPKVKKARKPKGESKRSKSTVSSSKPSKSDNVSPDEAEIKKLQGQLVKCGIRKIWAFELKQYGDNAQAKIKHLSKMLREAGMDGRFSEARAREIKEARELAADLEAVTELEKSWGMGRGSRTSRSRKPAPVADYSDDDLEDVEGKKEDQDSDDYDEDEDVQDVKAKGGAQRAVRAKQDLAFLGDEDEDSDD